MLSSCLHPAGQPQSLNGHSMPRHTTPHYICQPPPKRNTIHPISAPLHMHSKNLAQPAHQRLAPQRCISRTRPFPHMVASAHRGCWAAAPPAAAPAAPPPAGCSAAAPQCQLPDPRRPTCWCWWRRRWAARGPLEWPASDTDEQNGFRLSWRATVHVYGWASHTGIYGRYATTSVCKQVYVNGMWG